MKNRLSALAAGTAICALLAAPAIAGYTIYEDTEMPSVLFIEFDKPEGGEPEVISAPRSAAAPSIIEGGDTSGQSGGGGSAFADDDDGGDDEDEPTFEDQMDDAMTIDNDRIRDVVVDEVIRNELLDDIELR